MSALAAIHVGRKQLGLDEEGYRALLVRTGGKPSAKDMNEQERGRVLAEMRRLGFADAPRGRPASRRASGRYAAKLQALWIAGWNLGVVRNKDDAAMIAFVERQTGLSHTRFLAEPTDAAKAIEALKAWLGRDAGVDWSRPAAGGAEHQALPQYRIVAAQWRQLLALGAVPPSGQADEVVALETGYAATVTGLGSFRFYASPDWVTLMNALGARLRQVTSA